MEITDIKIRKIFDEGPLRGIVSITFENELAVHDVKVVFAKGKFFLIMPSRKNPDGSFKDIVHPINSDFRLKLETTVLEAYNQAVANAANNTDSAPEDNDISWNKTIW